MDPPLTILIVNEQSVPVDESRIVDVARRTAESEGAIGELSIGLVDAQRIAVLNEEHLQESDATDVLSFPVDGLVKTSSVNGPPPLIGEIVLCPEVAAATADSRELAEELDLLVAHGVLHLLGFDHETEEQAEQMRQRELAATGRSGARAS